MAAKKTTKKKTTKKPPPKKTAPRKSRRNATVPEHPYIVEALRPLAEPIDAVAADPANAMTHGEENLRAIGASLDRFGQRKPVILNSRTGYIEAGHGTLAAAASLGWTHIAVVRVDDDPATAHGYALADNRTAELAEWDQDRLDALLEELAEATPDLLADLALEDQLTNVEFEASAGGNDEAVDDRFSVVIECTGEAQQRDVYALCEKKGWKCRLLVL